MPPRRLPIVSLALALALGCGRAPAPNLLLVTLDTTRADRFGHTGHPGADTPRFDAFAAESIRFANAMAPVPVTLPSHTTILTGTHPVHHGVHYNDGFRVDERLTTLAEILGAEGWATAAFVSAFPLDARFNLDQGFDLYDDAFDPEVRGVFLERRAADTNAAALRWLDDRPNRPFFVWLHYFDPHAPYAPPPPYASRFAAAPYDGEIASMDEQFGRLLDGLVARGLAADTVVAVVGDHGESQGEHEELTHSAFLYDATQRVPLLVRAPGAHLGGRVVDAVVGTIDLAPTLLELLGVDVPAEMQGRSLAPVIAGGPAPGDGAVLLESRFCQLQLGWAPLRALRTDRYKYVEAPVPELYDLESDPGETVNVIAREPELAASLRERLWRRARALETTEPARSLAESGVESDTLAKLAALGYVGGGVTSVESLAYPSPEELATMPNPRDHAAFLRVRNFALENLRMGRLEPAIEAAREGLEIDPESAELHRVLGGALARLGRLDDAARELGEAAAREPERAATHRALGRVELRRGALERAVDELEIAVELEPAVETHLLLADALRRRGDAAGAGRTLEAALALDPSSLPALLALAAHRDRSGDPATATDLLRRAVALHPGAAEARYLLAHLTRPTDPAATRRLLEETIRFAPDHFAARLELVELLLETDDLASVPLHLDLLEQIAPDRERARVEALRRRWAMR